MYEFLYDCCSNKRYCSIEKIFQLDTATSRGSNGNFRFSSSHVCDVKGISAHEHSRMGRSGLWRWQEEKATGCERIENLRVG